MTRVVRRCMGSIRPTTPVPVWCIFPGAVVFVCRFVFWLVAGKTPAPIACLVSRDFVGKVCLLVIFLVLLNSAGRVLAWSDFLVLYGPIYQAAVAVLFLVCVLLAGSARVLSGKVF